MGGEEGEGRGTLGYTQRWSLVKGRGAPSSVALTAGASPSQTDLRPCPSPEASSVPSFPAGWPCGVPHCPRARAAQRSGRQTLAGLARCWVAGISPSPPAGPGHSAAL